jgi:hypothetical protein
MHRTQVLSDSQNMTHTCKFHRDDQCPIWCPTILSEAKEAISNFAYDAPIRTAHGFVNLAEVCDEHQVDFDSLCLRQ